MSKASLKSSNWYSLLW